MRDRSRKRGLPVSDTPGCTVLLQLGWFGPVPFSFPSKIFSIANTEHFMALVAAFFFFLFLLPSLWLKALEEHLLAQVKQPELTGTERTRTTWQGQCGEKNRTVKRCFISPSVFTKLYLHTLRVLGYSMDNAKLILTFAQRWL